MNACLQTKSNPFAREIAIHFEEAGSPAQAAPYFARAGNVAAAVYANDDAIALLNRSLAQLHLLPSGATRDAQELALQSALAAVYRSAMGWTSPEVMQSVERAIALSQAVGDARQRAQALYGAQSVYVVAAQFEQVESNYAEMSRLFVETEGSIPAFGGLMHAGARLHMGYAIEAHALFNQILAQRDNREVIDLQESQGLNYLVLGHAWNAHALWYLGKPASALEHATRAVNIAKNYAQPFSLVLAVTYLSTLLELQSDIDHFATQAEEAMKLAVEYRVPYYRNWASILVNFAHAWREPAETTIGQLRDSIEVFVSTGARLRLPYFQSLLARVYARGGRPEEGLHMIDEALDGLAAKK